MPNNYNLIKYFSNLILEIYVFISYRLYLIFICMKKKSLLLDKSFITYNNIHIILFSLINYYY